MKYAVALILVLTVFLFTTSFFFRQAKKLNKNISNEHFKIIETIDDNYELVIVSSHYNEDINWLKDADLPVVVCSKKLASPLCPIAENKGREASSFLKFIIDNYDNLPPNVAFIHGHEDAWHQRLAQQNSKSFLDIIRCAKYKEYGYVSLNNYYIDDRDDNSANQKHLLAVWDELFRPFLNRDPPAYSLNDCCAQFIVSRERILARPKEAYEHWYNYLIFKDPVEDNSYIIGVVFEFMWPIIFGEPDVVLQKEYKARFNCNLDF